MPTHTRCHADSLAELPNLGREAVRWLLAADIATPEALRRALCGTLALVLSCATLRGAEATAIEVPVVEGAWWRIATDDPDVSPHRIVTNHKSNVCDFTIFQDASGHWRAIACVRQTDAPGERLFFQWSAPRLDAPDWAPQGVLDVPRNLLPNGQPSSVQAPHGFAFEGKYFLFYNSYGARAMVGDDGVAWTPFANTEGQENLFRMGRDVMLFHDRTHARWIAYYCGNVGAHGAMVARTAPQLAGPWSPTEIPVRTEGNPESPFVIRRGTAYYLFQQMSVYRSSDPLRFEGQPIAHLTGIWFDGKWAPEVLDHEGQTYVSGYGDGLWLAKLRWDEQTPEQQTEWTATTYARILRERAAADERRKNKP